MASALEKLLKLGTLVGNLRQPNVAVSENLRTLRLENVSSDQLTFDAFSEIAILCDELNSPARILVDEEKWGEFDPEDLIGQAWSLSIGKIGIASALDQVDAENKHLFFFADQFQSWCKKLDPFSRDELDSSRVTSIFVRTLRHSFGSAKLAVLPWFHEKPPTIEGVGFPETAVVHELIHTVGSKAIHVAPAFYGLTWGRIDEPTAQQLLFHSVQTLAACLAQELRYDGDRYQVTLRGLRKVQADLSRGFIQFDREFNDLLRKIVLWVFSERKETAQKLIVDRLTLDIASGDSYIDCLRSHAQKAFDQAKDSYIFVIAERKDAYQKELREFMKDARTQADLFAAKVRDLISGLSRDFIAVLLVIGASVLAKADIADLSKPTVILFLKVLGFYLGLSCILQLAAHFRDAKLAIKESTGWLEALRTYSSSAELQEKFNAPLQRRIRTFYISASIMALFYTALIFALWNAESVAKKLV